VNYLREKELIEEQKRELEAQKLLFLRQQQEANALRLQKERDDLARQKEEFRDHQQRMLQAHGDRNAADRQRTQEFFALHPGGDMGIFGEEDMIVGSGMGGHLVDDMSGYGAGSSSASFGVGVGYGAGGGMNSGMSSGSYGGVGSGLQRELLLRQQYSMQQPSLSLQQQRQMMLRQCQLASGPQFAMHSLNLQPVPLSRRPATHLLLPAPSPSSSSSGSSSGPSAGKGHSS
jgi:hypothetical protein